MNLVQIITLLIYLSLTILILALDRCYPGDDIVNYVKYATMLTLFFLATILKKKYPEQKALNLALFFTVLADFFFVYCATIPTLKDQVLPFGLVSFTWAYLILIWICQKNFRLGWGELLAAGLVLALYLPYYGCLWSYVQGPKFYSLSLFGLILTYMSWTAICTLFRDYYSSKVSLFFALAGLFILISDLGVGLAISHPDYHGSFQPWLVNIIWAFYVPAWTIIVLIMAESKVYRQ